MKNKIQLLLAMIIIGISTMAQVSTNFNNENLILSKGQFLKDYGSSIDLVIPLKNIDSLLIKERKEVSESNEAKPFRLATPITVNLDIANYIKWNYDKEFAFGKFTIRLSGALSSSISFDKFSLPKNTELFVYNENGSMITGPVTEKENNLNNIWGSWVYKGEYITIEIKTPTVTLNDLILHSDNVAYGYKEIYKSLKVGGFGQSGPCNINVICTLGIGWEGERNSVSTILSANGGEFCTGALVMNTCGTNTPYYLTANHCFNGNTNTAGWRFAFQAWSTTCPNPGVYTNGVIYNGSTLRARNAATDFCLVELNTTPLANSGLHYAGWSRFTTPATSGVGIHHPGGDLMKISSYNAPLIRADNPNLCGIVPISGLSWVANWNNGVTEPGSSGSPLFDQNRRIVGQLGGGPSSCIAAANCRLDGYGRFDNSWTGGGTNSTRLSNWLDPFATNRVTTNTTNISNLVSDINKLAISGETVVCATSNLYTIPNLPDGSTISWSASPTGNVTINTPTAQQTTITKTGNNIVTLTANVNLPCQGTRVIAKTITVGDSYTTIKGTYTTNGSNVRTIMPYNQSAIGVVISQYSWLTINNTPINNIVASLSSSSTATGFNAYYGGFNFNLAANKFATVNFVGNGYCGLVNTYVTFYQSGSAFAIAASPNPANTQIEVVINKVIDNAQSLLNMPVSKNSKNIGSTKIYLYAFNNNELVKQWAFHEIKSSTYKLNIADIKSGYYLLKMERDNNIATTKIFVQY